MGVGVITKDPKSDDSSREISMHQAVMELFRQHKKEELEKRMRCGNLWVGGDKVDQCRVLTGWNGKPIFPDAPTKWFEKFVSKLDLSCRITFHGLRHTSATLLLANGVSLKNVSSRLGHSDANITLQVYAHALKSVDRIAADVLGSFIPVSNTAPHEITK
jgi:integrase